MSLRTKILHHSLPLLPTHSFTRHTLALALTSLPSSHPDHRADLTADTIIDTLFGEGVSAPGKALVEAWEKEGIERMIADDGLRGLSGILGDRLRWSASVGEHLVEVGFFGLQSSSSTTGHRVALPITLCDRLIIALRLMVLYHPLRTHTRSHFLPFQHPSSPSCPISIYLCTLHHLPFLLQLQHYSTTHLHHHPAPFSPSSIDAFPFSPSTHSVPCLMHGG